MQPTTTVSQIRDSILASLSPRTRRKVDALLADGCEYIAAPIVHFTDAQGRVLTGAEADTDTTPIFRRPRNVLAYMGIVVDGTHLLHKETILRQIRDEFGPDAHLIAPCLD